ncbi:MAG: exopolyphosphatase [Thermodesulfovibrionales bacterium]
MPLASIDVGSNSIRLLIGNVARGRVFPLAHGRVVTRLAEGVEARGLLSGRAMDATLAALRGYSARIREAGADAAVAVGTSALREASNAGRFLARVLGETGIDVEVVSGQREAELTARGVLSSVIAPRGAVIIDIGGGSTEWMLCLGGRLVDRDTLPVGVVKLLERHLRSDPPSVAEMRALKVEADRVADSVRARLEGRLGEGHVMVATAGTATTLAAVDLALEVYDPDRVQMHEMSVERLEELLERLASVPLATRRGVRGLEPERADLIIPGAVLSIGLVRGLGFGKVHISDHGLLEGALLELHERTSG